MAITIVESQFASRLGSDNFINRHVEIKREHCPRPFVGWVSDSETQQKVLLMLDYSARRLRLRASTPTYLPLQTPDFKMDAV